MKFQKFRWLNFISVKFVSFPKEVGVSKFRSVKFASFSNSKVWELKSEEDNQKNERLSTLKLTKRLPTLNLTKRIILKSRCLTTCKVFQVFKFGNFELVRFRNSNQTKIYNCDNFESF